VGSDTRFHTEGENAGVQEGPGVFVGHAQPADQLAGTQGDLILGIDLPGLVRFFGAAVGTGPASGVRRRQLGGVEPALQGARTGEGLSGKGLGQVESEVDGAPLGMELSQGEGVVAELGGPG
jgi:hypothetical protein